MSGLVAPLPLARARPRLADWIELTKPRITALILVTFLLGFYLAAPAPLDFALLLSALAGTALVCSGTAAFNQYLERDVDARMRRTEGRPLPAGRLHPGEALGFATVLLAAGLLILALSVNGLTAGVAFLTSFTYLALYTPLKRVGSLAILVGAVPGALPPVGGWTAAAGEIGSGALLLFAIVYVWQLPHFLAIGWLYREDYHRGGLPLIPAGEAGGRTTAIRVLVTCVALLPVSLAPAAAGMTGGVYLAGALVLGAGFLLQGARFARRLSPREARILLLASVIYLPLLGALFVLDRTGG